MAPPGAAHAPTLRTRRLCPPALFVTIGALLLTLALGACGGQPATTTYQCANGSSGCLHFVQFSQAGGDFSSSLSSAYTDMDVMPLTCDSACQASSNNPQAAGSVMNHITIFDASANFMRMGYMTDNAGHDVYFYDSSLPGQGHSLHLLGDTEIGPGYPDQATNTLMYIGVGLDSNNQPAGNWYALFGLQHAAQMGNAPANYGYDITQSGFDPKSFVPVSLNMGQYLYGTSGATAIFAGFDNTTIAPLSCGACSAVLSTDGQVITQPNGSVPPPYADWVVKPTAANSNGGTFYTECCQPVEIDISVVGGHNGP